MKLLLTITVLFICLTTYSQISFDVNAGANIGEVHTKINGEKDHSVKPSIGYIIPVHINIPIGNSLLFQTGLEFESIHHKIKTTGYYTEPGIQEVYRVTGKSHIEYVNIPLKIYYNINAMLRAGIGPFIGIGISGRSKSTEAIEINGAPAGVFYLGKKVKFGTGGSETKRLNFGLGLNMAYLLSKKILLGLYGDFGLSSINNHDPVKSRTIAGGLTIGYLFCKSKSQPGKKR